MSYFKKKKIILITLYKLNLPFDELKAFFPDKKQLKIRNLNFCKNVQKLQKFLPLKHIDGII